MTRSLTAVNLLAVDRDAFHALFSTLPPLRDFFGRLIEERLQPGMRPPTVAAAARDAASSPA